MPVPFHWYLILSALLFACGAVGVLTTRNVIVLLMGVEVMLNGANVVLDETAPLGRCLSHWSYYSRAKVEDFRSYALALPETIGVFHVTSYSPGRTSRISRYAGRASSALSRAPNVKGPRSNCIAGFAIAARTSSST